MSVCFLRRRCFGASVCRSDLPQRLGKRLLHAHLCWRLSLPGQFVHPPASRCNLSQCDRASLLVPVTICIVRLSSTDDGVSVSFVATLWLTHCLFVSSFCPGLFSKKLRVGVDMVSPESEGECHLQQCFFYVKDRENVAMFPFLNLNSHLVQRPSKPWPKIQICGSVFKTIQTYNKKQKGRWEEHCQHHVCIFNKELEPAGH